MGPVQSRTQNQEMTIISKNLLGQFIDPKVSQKFQRAQFYYKSREMKIHIPLQNKKTLTQWQQCIKVISDQQIKQYILLPKQYEFQYEGYCGSAGVVKIVYDYFPYSLDGEIQNKKKTINNDQFTQLEVWKLLYSLLKACHLMHLNWKKVGDIRPKNIFLNSEKQLRVSSQISNPKQLNNYQKFVFQKQATYISPEQLHDIKMGRIQPDNSRNAKQHIIQAQSWSVGLTLLHVTLLFNFQRLYQPIKSETNLNLLQQKISDLQKNNKYSLALKNIIRGMLQQIPQRRLLCSQLLLNYLTPYVNDIVNMNKFDSTKLNQQIKQLMEKKAINSLIGTIWKATSNGLIQSLVINTARQNQKETKAKEALIQELEKFSQIPPKNSQVSMRQSIRLGGSIRTLRNSLSKIKTSQVSNQSFHTVNSKKSSLFNQTNKISNFSLQNRFATGGNRIPTSGSNFSPSRNKNNFQMISQKFTTPMGVSSSYFHTIHNNSQSFDMNNFGLLNSVFRNSQALQQKDYQKLRQGLVSQESQMIEGNFKKNKDKNKKLKE